MLNGCSGVDRMSLKGVRREKAALSQWVKVPPGEDAPAGSNRSNCGGDEAVEAFGMRATI